MVSVLHSLRFFSLKVYFGDTWGQSSQFGDYCPQSLGTFGTYANTMLLTMFPSPVPASPPENVTVLVDSSTTIEVRWDIVPPIDQNGIITMYEVMYQPLETFNGIISTQTMNVSGTEMSVFLIELQEFVNYNISVRAYTSVGAGPYSDEVTVTTLEDSK